MQNTFEHNLIKGRIAEMVFEMMMQESNAYTIIPFGYENTIHELIHYRGINEQKQAIKRVKKTPDFVVLSRDSKTIQLVEVKYRRTFNLEEVKNRAEEIVELWNPSWLFLATPSEFYFDEAERIVKNSGRMNRFNLPSITPELKAKYMELLNQFEKDN